MLQSTYCILILCLFVIICLSEVHSMYYRRDPYFGRFSRRFPWGYPDMDWDRPDFDMWD